MIWQFMASNCKLNIGHLGPTPGATEDAHGVATFNATAAVHVRTTLYAPHSRPTPHRASIALQVIINLQDPTKIVPSTAVCHPRASLREQDKLRLLLLQEGGGGRG